MEPKVLINHFGSVVTKEPISFGKEGFIEFTEDTEPSFTGRSVTFAEFMNERFSLDETPTQTQGMSLT